jgi:hypothetical protein
MSRSAGRTPAYVAQIESVELIAAIIEGTITAEDDPLRARSGAQDRREYAFWAWRSCGVACLRSVLLHRLGRAPAAVVLAYAADETHVVFHNPSGHTPRLRRAVRLPIATFGSYDAERGIVIPAQA